MHALTFPSVAAVTAAVLAIMQVALTIYTIAGRLRFGTGIGDGGNEALSRRIRIHGNFVENAPIFLILLTFVEWSGHHETMARVFGTIFVVCRICHAYGLSMKFGPGRNPFRFVGMVGTMLSIVFLAFVVLVGAAARLI